MIMRTQEGLRSHGKDKEDEKEAERRQRSIVGREATSICMSLTSNDDG